MDLETAKPIIFNTEMVQAILDGRKTVTRRVIKFPVNKFTEKYPDYGDISTYKTVCYGKEMDFDIKPHFTMTMKTPYGLGDILYVRETWAELHANNSHRYVYRASDIYPFGEKYIVKFKWRPSIHMPKEAARIWLKVTDVRVERLQKITECQIISEGTSYDKENYEQWKKGDVAAHNAETYLRGCFMDLWNSTIKTADLARYGWSANPWVWVIKFEKMEQEN